MLEDIENRQRDADRARMTRTPAAELDEPKLIAYRLSRWPALRLARASTSRPWMEQTGRFANRCLPLLIANQAGWFILNSHTFRVTWTGHDDPSSLKVEYQSGYAPYPAMSHFGFGILTWQIPYLFRTPPGYNLLVRGPANWPKDGTYPLEGIVETDWAVATFTMNWKLTHLNSPVTFNTDEPICMLVPQRRGELETFRPEIRSLHTDHETAEGYRQWFRSRGQFLAERRASWQKHYFHGTSPGGLGATEHQRKLKLRDFDELESERDRR